MNHIQFYKKFLSKIKLIIFFVFLFFVENIEAQESKQAPIIILPEFSIKGIQSTHESSRLLLAKKVREILAEEIKNYEIPALGNLEILTGDALNQRLKLSENIIAQDKLCGSQINNQKIDTYGLNADLILCVDMVDMGRANGHWIQLSLYGFLIKMEVMVEEKIIPISKSNIFEENIKKIIQKLLSRLDSNTQSQSAPPLVNLYQGQGILKVESQPQEASVWINGAIFGKTPLERNLPEGSYEITLWARGYEPHTEHIHITKDKELLFKRNLDNNQITIHLSSQPTGVSVYAEDHFLGKTPLINKKISYPLSGQLTLRLISSGKRTHIIENFVQPGELIAHDINLEDIKKSLLIYVRTENEQIYVDGRLALETEEEGIYAITGLRSGDHYITLRENNKRPEITRYINTPHESVLDLSQRPEDGLVPRYKKYNFNNNLTNETIQNNINEKNNVSIQFETGLIDHFNITHLGIGLGTNIDFYLKEKENFDLFNYGVTTNLKIEAYTSDRTYHLTQGFHSKWIPRLRPTSIFWAEYDQLRFGVLAGTGIIVPFNSILLTTGSHIQWLLSKEISLSIELRWEPSFWNDHTTTNTWGTNLGLARRF
jgi:hypothetical protein